MGEIQPPQELGASGKPDRAAGLRPQPQAASRSSIPSAGHIPGPWSLSANAEGFEIYADLPHATDCVIAKRGPWPAETQRNLANARLIAAAPELLEALEGLLTRMANTPMGLSLSEWSDVAGPASAAIAKARGSS